MLPTSNYLHIMGQFSQDLSCSYRPWGGGSLNRLSSKHPSLWLGPWLLEMELKPAKLWVFTSQLSDITTGL